MSSALRWRGPMVISKHADSDVIIGGELEFTAGSLYHERMILISALETWLENWNREFGYHDRQASKMRKTV